MMNVPVRSNKVDYGKGNAIAYTSYFEHAGHVATPEECRKLLAENSKNRKPPKKSCDPKYQVNSCIHVSRS